MRISYRKSLITFICLVFYVNCQSLPQTYPTFKQYTTKYNKNYEGTELATRQKLYNDRVTKLKTLVSIKYTPGVNPLSDWNEQQIKSLKGLLMLSSPSGKNLPNPNSDQPASLNWANQKKVSPVKSQQKCGSDWAFAATSYAQSKLMVDGRYDNIELADQKLLQCTPQSTCKGGYLQYAMDSIVEGMPQSTIFTSYRPNFQYPGLCLLKVISIGRVTQNYYKLNDQQLITLLQQRPIAISLSANGWQNYASGVFQCSPSDEVNHAALLVGYDATTWIVKNSWGSQWGEGGYIRITRTPGLNCKIGTSAHRTFQWHLVSTIAILIILSISYL